MSRPRPPHLQREKTIRGKYVWYVRVGHGPRIRIKAEYGTPEFDAAYQAARNGEVRTEKPTLRVGSLAWLAARYRETPAWTSLSLATRRQRENILRPVISAAGHQAYAAITRATIVSGRDRRAGTPAQARHFIEALRGLFGWAVDAQLVKSNPTADVKNPKQPKTGGFPIWTEEEAALYERRWPIGTKERVWLDVLLYTGLRRGDAVMLGKQHIRGGAAQLRTQKSQGDITVTLPILPVLQRTLDAGPTGELAFIVGARGQPLSKEAFGNMFRKAVRAAGIKGKSCHGLRKLGATRAAENGATVAELEAIFGWSGGRMASLYTATANRAKLSRQAMAKLVNETATSIPAHQENVREPKRKAE